MKFFQLRSQRLTEFDCKGGILSEGKDLRIGTGIPKYLIPSIYTKWLHGY